MERLFMLLKIDGFQITQQIRSYTHQWRRNGSGISLNSLIGLYMNGTEVYLLLNSIRMMWKLYSGFH